MLRTIETGLRLISFSSSTVRFFSLSFVPITMMNSSQSMLPEPSVSTSANRSFSSWSVSYFSESPEELSLPRHLIRAQSEVIRAITLDNSPYLPH